jgi:hypothetical protein
LIAAKIFKDQNKEVLFVLYLLLSVTLLFIAGEEISWGQRILNIETPGYLVELNRQKEMNIHNLEPIQALLFEFYVLIGFYGSFAWLATRAFKTPHREDILCCVPGWYMMGFFLPVMLLYISYLSGINYSFGIAAHDQEWPELVLAIGFFLFIVITLAKQMRRFRLGEKGLVHIAP